MNEALQHVYDGLYDHQKQAVAVARARKGKAGLFMDMRTGKTRAALFHCWETGCQRILVCGSITFLPGWKDEAEAIGYPLPVVDLTALSQTVLYGTKRMKKLGPAIVLVNYESYWRKGLREAILAWGPDAVIMDEAQKIRIRTSKQSRFAHTLGDQSSVRVKLPLSGTPICKGLVDVWSIYRFMDPTIFGPWPNFQQTYIRYGGFQNKVIVGYNFESVANYLIAKTSFQCAKEDVFDLPPRQDIKIAVRLSPAARKIYDTLSKKAVANLQGLNGSQGVAVARTALTKILELQQITGGFVREDETKTLIDLSTEKAEAAREIVEAAHNEGEQVVIFARFIHDLDLICAELAKIKGLRVERLEGKTPKKIRPELRRRFWRKEFDVLVSQIKTGSLGIDLASANIAVFYSTGYALDDFLQARDRIYGNTQKAKSVVYYHLVAEKTIDETVMEALKNKVSIAQALTSLSYALTFFLPVDRPDLEPTPEPEPVPKPVTEDFPWLPIE